MAPANRRWWILVGLALLIAVSLVTALIFSKPGRIRYHKSRLLAAKHEHLRLRRGEYRFSDKARELLLGRSLTWAEVEADWKHHEDALVDLGFLQRVEYYPRRKTLPSPSDPEFRRIMDKMDAACPFWSYRVSTSSDSLAVTGTRQCLELWKALAPTVGLQPEKPSKDDRRCSGRGRRRSRRVAQRDTPISVHWSDLLGHPAQGRH